MEHKQELYYTELYISSDGLSYGTNNQPVILLDRALPNIRHSKYISASIPKTYYSINAFNNVFRFQEEIGVAFSAVVPAGNYTIAEFLIALKTAMDSASTNVRVYTITYSSITNRITISIGAGTFAVLGADALSLGHLLAGFPASNTAQASSHTGSLSQRVDTFPENLFIRGTLGVNSYASQINNISTSNNILVKIDAPQQPDKNGVIIDRSNKSDSDFFITDTSIDKVESYVSYKDINTNTDRIVDFNGNVWGFSVGLYSGV